MNLPFNFYPKYSILVMKCDLSFHSLFQWKKKELSLSIMSTAHQDFGLLSESIGDI